jgi:hypothetical protein
VPAAPVSDPCGKRSGLRPAAHRLIRATDAVLDGFEMDVAGLIDHRWEAATDAEVIEVIERMVRALHAINDQFHGAAP